jgi:hypothetical protein
MCIDSFFQDRGNNVYLSVPLSVNVLIFFDIFKHVRTPEIEYDI